MQIDNKKNERISPIQEQFYLTYNLNPENKAYNLASCFEITGPFDTGIFEKTIDLLSARYKWSDGEIYIYDKVSFSEEKKAEAINEPFILDKGALFRVHLWLEESKTYLLFLFHHIIFDLRSKEIFASEFCEIFNSLSQNQQPYLDPICLYDEYIDWYDNFFKSDKYKKMSDYWKNEPLGSYILNLPADRNRQLIPSSRGHRLFGSLPDHLAEKLRAYCEAESTDPFLVLLTAYAVFLNRFSGQDRFSIGVPRTNRPEGKFRDIMGCFVNILPLCVCIEQGMTFKELQRYIRLKMLGMHRNQNIPYLEVAKLNKGKRDAKYNPLFQVGFTSEHPMELELSDLGVLSLDAAPDAAQLDLFFYYWQNGTQFRLAIEYCSDLFTQERVEGFIESLITILEEGLENDSLSVSTIPLMDTDSRERIAAWNATDRDYDITGGIIDSFLEHAHLRPESKALIFRDEMLTYGELARRVQALAAFLKEKGVGPESIVGLSLERSFEMVIGMYAIVLAGGTYIPIEPNLPAEYITYIREDAQVSLILSKEVYRSLFPGLKDFIALDIFDYSGDVDEGGFSMLNPDSRVYILYTSGSTGRPKGVEITHRGLMNRILWMDEEYKLVKRDVLFQKTPYNFDVSGWEFWWPLMKGVSLVIAEPDGHKDNRYLVETIEKENISIIHFVPSMLREFLKSCRIGDCSSLRDVMCSGEALPAAVVREFYETLPHVRLHNLYGPTEASIDVTYWPCMPDCTVVPIGKPIANTKIHILDEALNPLPPGVTGEIYLAGVQLAMGYLNKPDLTSERFMDNPFDGGRMYKTGDLGQWNLKGEILYLGRNDSQVQLHGLRIELGEIENIMNDHPAVETAAVIIHGDFGADQSLIAYVAKKNEVSVDDLIAFLSQRLPLHMIPKRFFFLDEILLNVNGKLDRKSLPDPESMKQDSNKSIKLPKGEGETYIADIWKEILGLDKIGREENFFELGGSSIHIIQMQRVLSEKIGRDIPVTELFIHTSVRSLAVYLKDDSNHSEDEKEKLNNRAELSRRAVHRLKNVRKR